MFKSILFVPDEIKAHFQGDIFQAMMHLQGKAFRDVPGRKTMRVQINNKNYFIKQHFGVGWAEIFKNLSSLKLPILGSMTEVRAIQKLDEIGIATTPLVAYGQRGCSPATMQSFVLTEDLGDSVSLEEMLQDSKTYPMTDESKRLMLTEVAKFAVKLHGAGQSKAFRFICHRIRFTVLQHFF